MEPEVDTQWTQEARARFAAAVETLVDAVRRHGDAVLATTGRRAEIPGIFAANDELARMAGAYADAQFDFTGTLPAFAPADEDDDEEDEYEAEEPTAVVLMHRADYAVTDLDAVLAAGRAAYRRVWPQDTDEDATADVTDLARALYQVQHADGLSALDRLPGLSETGSRTWILDATDDEALRAAFGSIGDSAHEWDDDPAAWVREQRG